MTVMGVVEEVELKKELLVNNSIKRNNRPINITKKKINPCFN